MKRCRDIMTEDVVTATAEATIVDVARLMKNADIGPILIVDNEASNTLVGIVTDRDIVMKVIADGQDATTTRVGEVMSKKLVTCRADDDVDVAMKAMAQFQLRRIPVVEDNMRLVGIISQADLATRVDAPEKTGEVVKEISQENT
ncbi:MAG TPA: CBS domain-containing protein [Anaerolineales bacterium]|nr:CBS domain-containing protein [Anaerolineales bacterium]